MREGKILLAKRSPDRRLYPGVWDSVGGHCAPDEQPDETLVREIKEELGVTARRFKEIAVVDEPRATEYGEANYHVFVVTVWDGEPRLLGPEHSELRWSTIDQALELEFAHPDLPRMLRAALEQVYGRTWDI